MIYKKFLCSIAFSLILSDTFAQTAKELAMKNMIDSIKIATLSDYATCYPLLRQGFISTDIIGSSKVRAELNDKDLYKGNMNVVRIRSNFNFPLAQWGKNVVTGTVSYQQSNFDTHDLQSYNPGFLGGDRNITKSAVGFTATYSRSDSLFNHPISFSGSLSGLTDEFSSIKRINYLGTVTIPVSKNQKSSLTVGLVVIIDPSAIAPIIPVVSYWRKLDTDLDLYVDFPSRAVVRKQVSKRSWFFAGSELGGNLYFFKLDQPGLPQNTIFSSIDIKTGANFEYLVTKKLVLGVNGGLYTTASPRLFDHDDKPTAYFAKANGSSAPYISFSISFLPFLKSFR